MSLLTYRGHIEGRVSSTLSQDQKKFVTVGEDDMIIMWDTEDMTRRNEIYLSNPNGQIFTSIQYCQRDRIFVLGTMQGNVFISQQYNPSSFELIYKSQNKIETLSFSESYKYLSIVCHQMQGIIFDRTRNRFFKSDTIHNKNVVFSFISKDQTLFLTYGADGYVNIHKLVLQSINPIQFFSKYQMCHNETIQTAVNFHQHPVSRGHFSFGGASTLQELLFTQQMQPSYKIISEIHEQHEILNVYWLNDFTIIVSTQKKVSFWNYTTKVKFQVMDYEMKGIIGRGSMFMAVGPDGLVYKYQNQVLFKHQETESANYLLQLKRLQQQPYNNISNNNIDQEEIAEQTIKIKKKTGAKRVQVPSPAELIIRGPQTAIESSYQMQNNSKFLFYNSHGCVIKRVDCEQQLTQLEYHDKFKIRKLKFQVSGKYFCYFALTKDCFMYSSLNHAYFQMQPQKLKKGNRNSQIQSSNQLIKWDYKIRDVQALGVGNTWAAICSKQDIRIFDFFGNELHIISFDRTFLAMAAYEDLLAVCYSSGIPLGLSHQFEMKIYRIDNFSWKLQRKVQMPVRAQQQLKWFGFSQQGCIYNQDSSETIRMYLWESNQWINVLETDKWKYKIYVQHIENYQIYGFKIEQVDGEAKYPTVMPRSLPKRIPFQANERRIKFLTEQENRKVEQIFIRKLSICHQSFRSKRWYKYKYSRNEDHQMFQFSEKIKSQQELENIKVELDIFIVDQIKRIIPDLNSRLSPQQLEQAKSEILKICQNLVYFTESIQKIRGLLGSNPDIACLVTEYDRMSLATKKYNKISRLDLMVDLGWIQNH